MYGVRLARIGQILGRAILYNALFGQNGALKAVCLQIEKACIENDIAMVKALLKTIANQDMVAFSELQSILKESISDEELQELLS